MDTLTGIALLAVLVVVYYLWVRLKAEVGAAATRVVMGGTHKRGQAEVHAKTFFSAPGAAGPLLDEIIAAVNPHPKAPALVGGVYLKGRSASRAVFSLGSAMGDSFILVVDVHDEAPGARGTLEVTNWTETSGLVDGVAQMEKIRQRALEVVEAAGGSGRTVVPA